METKGKRLKRLEGSSNEALLTLLNSQGWFFVDKELKPAAKKKFHNLLILGITRSQKHGQRSYSVIVHQTGLSYI